MKNFHFRRLIAGAMLALVLSVSLGSSLDAKPCQGEPSDDRGPVSGIYAFGDSLTDTGNASAATGGLYPPEEYYYEGRFSNGIIWIEHLAEKLRLAPESIVSFAFGGATTGDQNGTIPGLPGLEQQLDAFETGLGGEQADERALYVLWVGANDLLVDPTGSSIGTSIANTAIAVARLHDAGARQIMVVNLPDLGLTPLGVATGNPTGLSMLVEFYNINLDNALDQLDCLGIETMRLDSATILRNTVGNPRRFGFSNVVDAYLSGGVGDPSEYLFWDTVHPTTDVHRIIAKEAMKVFRRSYSHSWSSSRSRR